MRRAYSFLAVLAIAFTTLTPALAVADSYGAIAFSPSTRADGWSNSFSTRADAERRALRECSARARDCRVAIWFKNACGALAVGAERRLGFRLGVRPQGRRTRSDRRLQPVYRPAAASPAGSAPARRDRQLSGQCTGHGSGARLRAASRH